jgi:hypothetical protein
LLAENDFNLSVGRYKPLVSEKPPEQDPVELINGALRLEREITRDLEKLLNQVDTKA